MSVGDNIRNLRKERGLTQERMAKLVGISRNYLSELENDKRGLSQATLEDLSRALEVTVSYLMYGPLELSKIEFQEGTRTVYIYFNTGEKLVVRVLATDGKSDLFPETKARILGLKIFVGYYPDKIAFINKAPNFVLNTEENISVMEFTARVCADFMIDYFRRNPHEFRVVDEELQDAGGSINDYIAKDGTIFYEVMDWKGNTISTGVRTFAYSSLMLKMLDYKIT